MPHRLSSGFFDRPALAVARGLLGATVSHAGVTVRLSEVEAYAGEADPGSHAFRGRTARTSVMFGPPGGLYVYFTYGMHWCANLVCGPEGTAAAVLLRGGEVVDGIELARDRRRSAPMRDLARGPARLASCLALGRSENGLTVTAAESPVVVRAPREALPDNAIRSGPRVGVRGPGGDGDTFPWRLWIAGDPTVSTYRPAAARRDTGWSAGGRIRQAGGRDEHPR